MKTLTSACTVLATIVLSVAMPHQTASAVSGVSFVGVRHSNGTAEQVKSVAVPTGAAPGDTLVLAFTRASSVAWSGPQGTTGWRQIDSFSGANSLTSTVWVKTVQADDLGSTVHFDTTQYSKAMVTLADYAGADSAIDPVTAHRSDDTVSTSHVSPSASVPAGATVLSYWVDKSDATNAWTGPTQTTTRDTAIGTGTGRYSSLLVDTGPAPGGTSPGVTATTDGASRTMAWTIALSPQTQSAPPPTGVTKLMVIWEENDTTAVYDRMPYLKSLSETYGRATSYSGLVHPSLGNYLAATSGQGTSTCGLSDPLPAACPQPGPTVFGQALAAGKSAKVYAESMPANCTKTNTTLYAARHNPWTYFPDEATQCGTYDVPLGTSSGGALLSDLSAGQLPDASMVVPNLQNDLHDGTPAQADSWLSTWIPLLTASPDYQSGDLAIVITFDEGIGTNQTVPFVVISPGENGRTVTDSFNHYALCRLFDDVLGVSPLNSAADAPGLRAAFGL